MDKFQNRYTRFGFVSICIGSIALVVLLSRCSTSFFDYSLQKFEFSFPDTELLRRNVYTTNAGVVVDSRDVSQQILSLRSTTNSSVTLQSKPEKLNRRDLVEEGLAKARASILEASSSSNRNNTTTTLFKIDLPNPDIYRNPSALHRSYLEMEKRFKVYVYEEGEPPLVHDGPCKSVYAVEGRFITELEKRKTRFRTYDPSQAYVYFLPFSVSWLVRYLYEGNSNAEPLRTFVSDYIRLVSTNHPFWNRTNGADHFMLACHDWGPLTSKANKDLFNTSIRVMCNANSSEGFNPAKDVTLPEIKLYGGVVDPKLRLSKTLSASPRPYLGFFAGGVHGPVRPILLKHWKQRDPDMPVYEYLPKHLNYYDFMRSSKFCFCPSGYEVASPRVTEAIYSECIPVILSVNFVLPFTDVLRWETFSVLVDVSDIPRLKEILMSISDEKYEWLKRNLRSVRRHFELNDPPKRFDAFHLTLHSIWLRRLNLMLT
ncbi:PREDICTED: probable glycosyltransferase At5g25310 [Camelina sativa]|uniref:Probable glycosyltransferase At5g25310 n=1 Tax=Camelina sativa TaxID=90675 RepID=A0ABM0VEA1_CAMSA|nr:PREDICTED: probable glycosyltransferase At5g25310 [Camelina sativa]